MNISISNEIHHNIRNITKYTLNISTNYANRVVQKIYSTFDSIKYLPHAGRYVPELSDKHYRERICNSYRIIYFVSEFYNTIFIRYIFSGKQNSNLFFKVHKDELINFSNKILF